MTFYDEGQYAYWCGIFECPYDPFTFAYDEWNRGWCAAVEVAA